MWKLTMTPVDGETFTVNCEDYEASDGCLYMRLSKTGEHKKFKIFPLSALLEITADEQP
jgi:hypothetical protein